MARERSYTNAAGPNPVRAMGLAAWAERMSGHPRALGLAGLLVAFTGVTMLLNPTHATSLVWLGLALLAVGAGLFAFVIWPRAEVPAAATPSMGARLIRGLALDGRLIPWFPALGVAIVVLDLTYNYVLSASPALLTEDIIVLLSAAALLGYGLAPPRYARERDFVLLFFVFLDLLLVVPLLAARVVTHSIDASVDVYSWTALAPETGAVLSLLGVPNSVHAVAGFTAPGLTFTPVHSSVAATLVISTACSGIYSLGIFAAAYIAFLLTEYAHPSRRLWLVLGLGFLASYAANVLRMVIIVLVGYYTDTAQSDLQNLLLAHSYAGWVVFLAWLALFWGVLFRFLPLEKDSGHAASGEPVPATPRVRGNVCPICRASLSPAIPATRCACGAIYHAACLGSQGECPTCHRKPAAVPGGVPGGD
jgi:exosortase/archaeosortase family protein